MPVLKHCRSQFNHLERAVHSTDQHRSTDTESHEKENRTHERIDGTDDLVHWKKSRKNIITEDYVKPHFLVPAGKICHKSGRTDDERNSHRHKQEGNHKVHDTLHSLAQVF